MRIDNNFKIFVAKIALGLFCIASLTACNLPISQSDDIGSDSGASVGNLAIGKRADSVSINSQKACPSAQSLEANIQFVEVEIVVATDYDRIDLFGVCADAEIQPQHFCQRRIADNVNCCIRQML